MKIASTCFLTSLLIHIIFICILFFSFSINKQRTYFTVINKDSLISVNIIDDTYNNINNEYSLSNNKNINSRHDLKHITTERSELGVVKGIDKRINKNNVINSASSKRGGQSIEIIPVIKNDNIINFIPPVYPKSSLILKQEGTVVVRVLVSNEGKIIENKIYKSSGYKGLDYAVLKVANLWTVNIPPLKTSWIEVIVNFIIK